MTDTYAKSTPMKHGTLLEKAQHLHNDLQAMSWGYIENSVTAIVLVAT